MNINYQSRKKERKGHSLALRCSHIFTLKVLPFSVWEEGKAKKPGPPSLAGWCCAPFCLKVTASLLPMQLPWCPPWVLALTEHTHGVLWRSHISLPLIMPVKTLLTNNLVLGLTSDVSCMLFMHSHVALAIVFSIPFLGHFHCPRTLLSLLPGFRYLGTMTFSSRCVEDALLLTLCHAYSRYVRWYHSWKGVLQWTSLRRFSC